MLMLQTLLVETEKTGDFAKSSRGFHFNLFLKHPVYSCIIYCLFCRIHFQVHLKTFLVYYVSCNKLSATTSDWSALDSLRLVVKKIIKKQLVILPTIGGCQSNEHWIYFLYQYKVCNHYLSQVENKFRYKLFPLSFLKDLYVISLLHQTMFPYIHCILDWCVSKAVLNIGIKRKIFWKYNKQNKTRFVVLERTMSRIFYLYEILWIPSKGSMDLRGKCMR